MFVSDFNGNGTLELNEFFMGGKAVVLATPEIAGLPYVISGLVAAGGMAAAMSTADGFSFSNCKCFVLMICTIKSLTLKQKLQKD